MGVVSSISSTQVESLGEPSEDDGAVAKPLKPAYAPNPSAPERRPPTAPAAYPWPMQQSQGGQISMFYGNPQRFHSPPSIELDDSCLDLPDDFSHSVTNPSLPFQPSNKAFQSPGSAIHTSMDYYPMEMGSMRTTGIILSRAVRMLEATPPAYLIVPEHPNAMASTPLSAPPAPPNTSHGQRFSQNMSQYPDVHKTRSRTDMVASRDIRGDSQSFHGPRPPTVG